MRQSKKKDIVHFIKKNDHGLFKILIEKKILTEGEAGALTYALIDIAESVEKIYLDILPKILKNRAAKKEALQDLVWDIRDEFRHIQYHMDDAKLTEL